MVFFFVFLCLVLLVACVAKHFECKELHERLQVANANTAKAEELEQLNAELKAKVQAIQQDDSESQVVESGRYVRIRDLKRATPETYQIVFDLDVGGQRVLEDLTARYFKNAYATEIEGGERETCYRLGQRSVVNHIMNQINRANEKPLKEEEDHDA